MLRRAVIATALVTFAAAAPAEAALRASGTLTRVSGGILTLTVRNTGDEPFSVTRFTGRPGTQFLNPQPSAGSCFPGTTEAGPTLYCDATVAPGGTLSVRFATEPPYPDGSSGRLDVQRNLDDPRSHSSTVQLGGAPAGQPVVGKSERVEPVSGTVLVRRRGSRRFVRLRAGQLLPDRSEIDTRRGVARVVVAAPGGATESALVSEGRAVIDQDTAAQPTTTLKLSQPLACPRARSAVAAAKRRRKRRLFLKTDGGHFRTRGNYAAATASGTAWRTTDLCTSTRIDVREGTVIVTDLRTNRSFPVTAPGSYTASKGARRRSTSPTAPRPS